MSQHGQLSPLFAPSVTYNGWSTVQHNHRPHLHLSPTHLGRLLGGRDHSTVIHGAGKINGEVTENGQIRQDILAIKEAIFSKIFGPRPRRVCCGSQLPMGDFLVRLKGVARPDAASLSHLFESAVMLGNPHLPPTELGPPSPMGNVHRAFPRLWTNGLV